MIKVMGLMIMIEGGDWGEIPEKKGKITERQKSGSCC
jgi:hypothetical protein